MNKIQKKLSIEIRQMNTEDLERVMEINRLSFTDPWPKRIFESEVNGNEFAKYFIIEADDLIVGYVGLWFVFDDAQITNIAVHPDYRGHGYGETLFSYAMQQAILHRMKTLSLEVRVSNKKAQHLYRKFGLFPTRVRKKYYKNNGEDAFVMEVSLS